jgi:hypothetical protein
MFVTTTTTTTTTNTTSTSSSSSSSILTINVIDRGLKSKGTTWKNRQISENNIKIYLKKCAYLTVS